MLRLAMKRDGRSLDHATLETIRTMAVERVREGERPSEVIASYGFHRCTIYGWLKTARGRGRDSRSWRLGQRRTATDLDCGAGAAGVSLDQRQESDPVWV